MKEFPREDWTDSVYAIEGAVLLEPVPSDALEARGAGFVWEGDVDFNIVLSNLSVLWWIYPSFNHLWHGIIYV